MRSRSQGLVPLRIRSVLLPLDGSPLAEQAIPWAAAIARRARVRLRLALVHQSPSPPPLDRSTVRLYNRIEVALRKSEREYLRRVAARIPEAGDLKVVTVTLTGKPAPALRTYAHNVGVDLVVMTTHGRGGWRREWIGSVADELVRSLEIPLVLIRASEGVPTREPSLKEILVPLDGSRRAEAALPPALGLATLFGAAVSLVQAVEPVPVLVDVPLSFPPALDESLTAARREQAEDYLKDVVAQIAELGIATRSRAVLCASAIEGIRAASGAPGIGMIALATHGRGGLRRMVLGSVTDKLVRMGEHPVLVIRPRSR